MSYLHKMSHQSWSTGWQGDHPWGQTCQGVSLPALHSLLGPDGAVKMGDLSQLAILCCWAEQKRGGVECLVLGCNHNWRPPPCELSDPLRHTFATSSHLWKTLLFEKKSKKTHDAKTQWFQLGCNINDNWRPSLTHSTPAKFIFTFSSLWKTLQMKKKYKNTHVKKKHKAFNWAAIITYEGGWAVGKEGS